MKALVAEDNALIRECFRDYLSKRSIEVTAVNNGALLFEEARKKKYDFVVTDYRMPKMDGIEAARRIREFNHSMPIYLFSADIEEEHKKRALKAGITSCHSKDDLGKELELILKNHKPSSQQ